MTQNKRYILLALCGALLAAVGSTAAVKAEPSACLQMEAASSPAPLWMQTLHPECCQTINSTPESACDSVSYSPDRCNQAAVRVWRRHPTRASHEFVTFCVDWDCNGSFSADEAVGLGSVHVHDDPGPRPVQYAVYRDIDPPGSLSQQCQMRTGLAESEFSPRRCP
jgi:hypothetical protein